MDSGMREWAGIALLLGAVIFSAWLGRRRVRPWHLYVAAGTALVSVAETMALLTEARSGAYANWGGMGMAVLLIGAGLIAAISVTASLAMGVMVSLYGFYHPTPAQREADRAYRRSPQRRVDLAWFRLKFSMAGLVIVLGVIAVQRCGR